MDFKNLHIFLFLFNQSILRKQKFFLVKKSFFILILLDLLYKNNLILGFSILNDKFKVFLKYYKNKAVISKLVYLSYKKSPVFHKKKDLWKDSVYYTNTGLHFSSTMSMTGGLFLFQIKY